MIFSKLSISLRIFLLTATGLLVGLLITGILLTNLYSTALTRNIDAIAEQQLDALIARVLAEDEASLQTLPSIDPRYTEPNSGWYWQITKKDESILGVSSSSFGINIPTLDLEYDQNNSRKGNIFDDDGNWLRILERKLFISDDEVFTITVTADWDEIAADVGLFRQQAIIVLAFMGVFLAILCGLIARLSFGPLLKLSASVQDVRTGQSERIEGEYPVEIAPLKGEINALLSANDQILQRAKNHVGDLAHGLKTPIAVMRNELKGEGAEIAYGQLDRMQAIVARYLDRAQLAARTAIRGRTTDLKLASEKITKVMQKLNPEKTVSLEVRLERIDKFHGDPEDFDEMLGNLVDNGLKWSKGAVRISVLDHTAEQVKIVVEDDGPGISEEERSTILKRGKRLDEEKPGSGLGLGIVSELVSVYGGSIELDRSDMGGLQVSVILPAIKQRKS